MFFFTIVNVLHAQPGCVLQPPSLNVDFGSALKPVVINHSSLVDYNRINGYCPQDGNYAIVSGTSDCFDGHWITLNEDRTPGDVEGRMLLVNAAYQPGPFFVTRLQGLLPNTTYELGAWVINVCKPRYNCTFILPNLRFTLSTADGAELAKFSTGILPSTGNSWRQYAARFKTPANVGILTLTIDDKIEGGCGNDFAIDDITFSECRVTPAPVKEKPKPEMAPVVKQKQPVAVPVIKPKQPVAVPVVKPKIPITKPVQKDNPVLARVSVKDSIITRRPAPAVRPSMTPLPPVIMSRANPVVKQIETGITELLIDLYDNGDIDGDTVSIYHNNTLIVSRAALTAKAISFRLNIDASHPHHELVMVANNLGSIPPNTSLMVITDRDKRYEVFISSSEQKNAKILIDLKK